MDNVVPFFLTLTLYPCFLRKDKELKAAEIELREAEAGFKAVEKAIDEAMAQIPINNRRLEKAEAHLRKLKAEQ